MLKLLRVVTSKPPHAQRAADRGGCSYLIVPRYYRSLCCRTGDTHSPHTRVQPVNVTLKQWSPKLMSWSQSCSCWGSHFQFPRDQLQSAEAGSASMRTRILSQPTSGPAEDPEPSARHVQPSQACSKHSHSSFIFTNQLKWQAKATLFQKRNALFQKGYDNSSRFQILFLKCYVTSLRSFRGASQQPSTLTYEGSSYFCQIKLSFL